MNEQLQYIGIYADSITAKENAEWEKQVREAVIKNSREYREQKELENAMISGIAAATASGTEQDAPTATDSVKNYYSVKPYRPIYKPKFTDLMLCVIAFLLLLNLIFNK